MIRKRATSFEVVVHVGRDPITGRERRVSRSVPFGPGAAKAARDLEARLKVEVGQGQHRAPRITVGQLCDLWLERAAPERSPTTMVGYRGLVRRYVQPLIGDVRLDRLSAARLDRMYHRLRTVGTSGRPLGANTVRHVHALLRAACDAALRWHWIPANPVLQATPPRVPHTRVDPPDVETLQRILSAAAAHSDDLGDFVAVAMCGLRRGESCGLRWADIDLDAGTLRIRGAVVQVAGTLSVKEPKTPRSRRRIDLPAFVVDRLRDRAKRSVEAAEMCGTTLDAQAFVFSETADGTVPLAPDTASKRYMRLVSDLGVATRLHDLRHALVTLALTLGASPREVAAYVGHARPSTTLDVYAHSTPEGLRRIAYGIDVTLGQ